MDLRNLGFDSPLLTILEDMLDIPEEQEKTRNNPSRAYVRDAKAMAATPADVMEYPTSYREKEKDEKEGVKYVRMERRVGKFMRKFQLPENANMDKISAVCKDGVLRVTVEKLPPPEPKKPKTIEVKVA
ncbi:18.8 kDa class II heat shock protein [Hibiscus syriacus]|uniref:18.8 kDa class II heat shock protein n=1 Tax=Hibiscus syriacus TaxID=106335 RepID=A0A6A2YT12_HIBSY|nr:18.8 kDa class II heat shock protein [Hibiscus syriacus]